MTLDVGEEERRILDLLDLLCRDSLEAPLSHVDNPQADGQVTAWFRELRDLVLEAVRQAEELQDLNHKAVRVFTEAQDRAEQAVRQRDELREAVAEYRELESNQAAPGPLKQRELTAARERLDAALAQATENPSHPNTEVEERT